MSETSITNLQEILLAQKCGDKEALHEASLARIWQHVANAGETGMAILTSWRAGLSKEENLKRFESLKSKVRGLGKGFVVIKGHWRESQDPSVPYDQAKPEELLDVVEPALVVPKLSLEQAHALGNQYEQDAILFAGPETKGNAVLVFSNGSKTNLGHFSPNTISQGFSELIGSRKKAKRTFKFEGLSWPIQSYMEAIIAENFKTNMLNFALNHKKT